VSVPVAISAMATDADAFRIHDESSLLAKDLPFPLGRVYAGRAGYRECDSATTGE
jgi:hypothetical protein